MLRLQPTACGRFLVVGLLLALTGCQGGLSYLARNRSQSELSSNATASTAPVTPPVDPERKELPNNESAALCLTTAQSMDRAGRIPEAIGLYVKARQLDPSQKAISRRLAVLFDRVGEFNLANHEYDVALQLTPNDPALLNDRGYSFYCQGKMPQAEEYLRKSVDLEPKQERTWVNLGMALTIQGRYAEGLEAFRRVLPDGQAHANLAFIQATQNKRDEATASYRKALEIDPSLSVARAALAKMDQLPEGPNGGMPVNSPALVENRTPRMNQGIHTTNKPEGNLTPVSYDEEPISGISVEPSPVGQSGFTPMR